MYQRALHIIALCVTVLACAFIVTPATADTGEVSPQQSVITTGSDNTVVDPYQSFNFTISLKTASGTTLSTRPAGKLYIWATDSSNRVCDGLDLVKLSIPDGVYIHETSRQGVLVMDAGALVTSQKINLLLDATGTYELHALYMPTGSIDPSNVTEYWPYELTGGALSSRCVKVNPTPASDVAVMAVSTKIRGIGVDSFFINNPRNQTVTTPISIDASGATATEVQFALLRANGLSVGKDVPIYVSTNTPSLAISNVMVRTDVNGIARVNVSGIIGAGATLQIRCALTDVPVTVPLRPYEYRPEKVRLSIGSKEMNVDGRIIEMDTAPCVKDNRTFVPFRAIGELLGARVEYDSNVNSIITTIGDTTLTMSVGYNHYAVNGTIYQMDTAPFVNSDYRTMVPIRFVAEVIGYDVLYSPGVGGAAASVIFERK